ncbi:hypothetical protein F5148DRAFT_1292501 [Russula earlei]|uniref:Uncharacterized protein n=1 Tax=Russula earlei TaxID=71964 RepID=A0ACC0TTC8_9AGAM|nr:hypothetical protein F5148DRAFT_1292501 [Russula earlei]
MPDQEIIAQIRSGKHDKAFNSLYRHFPMMHKMVSRNGGTLQDAEDVFQEALIILCRKVKETDFELTAQLSTYLFSICRFVWKDELRKRQHTISFHLETGLTEPQELELQALLEREAAIQLAEKVLVELADRCRELLLLFYKGRMALKDIAIKMGYSSENTAKNQKYKCLEGAKNKLKELKQSLLKQIEAYLAGELPANEKRVFETQIANDPALQEEVQLQQQIMQGIERAVWKQEVQQAKQQFKRNQHFRNWGTTGFIVIVTSMVLYYTGIPGNSNKAYTNTHLVANTGRQTPAQASGPVAFDPDPVIDTTAYTAIHLPAFDADKNFSPPSFSLDTSAIDTNAYTGTHLPVYNEAGKKEWADADKQIPAQNFQLNASRDTVIETKGGIVLSIPAYCFLDEHQQPVTGQVAFTVKEALDAATIMQAGLSTQSGNQLLETGGMFFTDARQSSQSLTINPANGIYTEVPARTIQPGMQLYTGHRAANGTIDWVNSRPLEHNLIPVDIQLLYFYPPGYLDSLQKWGYDSHNKAFTDSLYYSLAVPQLSACGLDPAKIKAIWDNRFNNTLLATREFERRLCQLHKGGNNQILDLYVNNLDKNLYEIDSMAASLLTGRMKQVFLSFYNRHDGKVASYSTPYQKLRRYYEVKTQAYTEAITKTQKAFWDTQAELDFIADNKSIAHKEDSVSRIKQNFTEELELNLKAAFQQLGYTATGSTAKSSITTHQTIPCPPSKNVYRATVINTGWCNIDRAVYAATANRTTLDFTDPQTGKRAVIQYKSVSFTIQETVNYDRIYLYLLPNKLTSFMRVTESGGQYREQLDELMRYNMICIAYKGEQAFSYSLKNIQPVNYPPIALTAIAKNQLDKQLNEMGGREQIKSGVSAPSN